MSDNPYPRGRWTTSENSNHSAATSQRVPLFMQPAASLLKAPLRDLFWGLPDSNLLEEARQRVEGAIASALARDPVAPATQPLALI
jgi:hypothetical protein